MPEESEDPLYEGLPYALLPIDAIDWTHRAEHIRTRRLRYDGRKEVDLEPEWATQAALDPDRLVGPGSGRSVEVVGFSPDAPARTSDGQGRVLKVWIVPKEPTGSPPEGEWWGASACDGNERDRREYWRGGDSND